MYYRYRFIFAFQAAVVLLLSVCCVAVGAQPIYTAYDPYKKATPNRFWVGYTPMLRDYILHSNTASSSERILAVRYMEAQTGQRQESLTNWEALLDDAYTLSNQEKSIVYREMGKLLLPHQPKKALAHYVEASTHATPYDFRLQEGQASAHKALGQDLYAAKAYKKAHKARKKVSTKYLRRAEEALYKAEYHKAFVYSEYVLAADSTIGIAYYYRALTLRKIGAMLDTLIAACNEAIYHLPRHSNTYALRGHMYLLKKDTLAAEKDMEKAIQLDPRLIAPRLALGTIYTSRKNYETALDHYTEALRIDRGSIEAYIHQAYIYHKMAQQESTLDMQYEMYSSALHSYERALILLQSSLRLTKKHMKAWKLSQNTKELRISEVALYSANKLSNEVLTMVQGLRKQVKGLSHTLKEREFLRLQDTAK